MNELLLNQGVGAGFHIADSIRGAAADGDRARILLRIPDEVLWRMAARLSAACAESGFRAGTMYVAVRLASSSAVRDTAGELPPTMADQIAYWRTELVGIAAGVR